MFGCSTTSNRKVLGLTPDRSTRIFFPSMPVSLSRIIHHSHEFIHQAGNIPSHLFHIPHVRHLNPSSMQDICPMNLV